MAKQNVDKILYLESMRGIAALTVAIMHFELGSIFKMRFITNSWLMVDFFFVLSGFVIALNYQSKLRTIKHIFNFQARRFLRLYPLHFATLLLFLGIECAKYLAEVQFQLLANNQAFTRNNLWSFLENVLLIQNLSNDRLTWNFPSWSISAEFYTYLVFAIIAVLTGARQRLFVVFSATVSAGAFFFLFQKGMMLTKWGFIRCLHAFFLGCLCFNLSVPLKGRVPNILSYILLGISLYLIGTIKGTHDQIGVFIPIVFSLFLLSLIASGPQNKIKTGLDNRFLIYLGTISYGIYMIHAGLWWVAGQILRQVFHFKPGGVSKIIIENAWVASGIMLLGLIVLVGLSHLSYKFIEMPLNAYRRKIGRFS